MKPRLGTNSSSGIGMRVVWFAALILFLNVSSAYAEMYIGVELEAFYTTPHIKQGPS